MESSLEMQAKVSPAVVEEKVPLKSRIWVSAADGAIATFQGLAGSATLTYYFTRWRGLSADYAALVWIIFGIWNAINDPLFGFISDRTKSKLGRRIPYIRYGAPIFALSFIAAWVEWPTAGSQLFLFFQMLLILFIYDTLYTAIATSVYIMPYEMAISNKARGSIYIWKLIFNAVAIAVPLVVVPNIQPGPGEYEKAQVFRWIMTAFGIFLGSIIFFSTFFYKEKHFQQEKEQFAFFKSLKECFTNFSFIVFEVFSFTLIYVQTGLMMGVLYYFDEFKVPQIPIFASLAAGIVIGVVVWVTQRDRWGVKKAMQIMSLAFGVGCLIMLFFGDNVIAGSLSFFLLGTGFSGGMYLTPLMNGDVIDMDEHRTGLRREGMYAGVNSFITKPAISIAQAVFLYFLGVYGYDQTLAKGMQDANAQAGILVAWMLVPGLLLLSSFILLHWYPLAGSEWDKIKRRLAAMHDEEERKYLEKIS